MSNAESVTIRTFHTDDLPALRRMTVEAFEGVSIDEGIEHAFGVINGRDWRWRKGRHVDLDAVRDPDGIFVAEFEGRPIGYVSTWKDHPGGIGHIPNLVVLPEHRGEGIGRNTGTVQKVPFFPRAICYMGWRWPGTVSSERTERWLWKVIPTAFWLIRRVWITSWVRWGRR